MFDNVFVILSAVADSDKNSVVDHHGNPIESRTYSGLLATFMRGIPAEFQVSGYLRDNERRGPNGQDYLTEQILDSRNNPLLSQAVFVTNKKSRKKGD